MFAKVFGQIFDSSIAEDYNCRRMFMDLLVLADSDGVVDMTAEAICRRTNVPIAEVTRYIKELCQPDPTSRSKLEEGKRLIPLDSKRDWGWKIVNYAHYRRIKDEEARRSYFRDAQRKYRRGKRGAVFDKDLTGSDGINELLPPSSASSSKSRCTQKEAEDFCQSIGMPRSDGEAMFLHWEEKGWGKVKDWKLTIRKWKSFGYLPSQKKQPSRNGPIQDRIRPINKAKIDVPERFKSWVAEKYPAKREDAMKWKTWQDVPNNGLREEWWKQEKGKLGIP